MPSNPYYDHGTTPLYRTPARSADLRTELDNITTGFDTVDTDITALETDKAPIASPTFTGDVGLPATTSIGNVSAAEIAYLDGVTSAIQTQINAKAPTISPALSGTPTAPTAATTTNNTQLATTEFVQNVALNVSVELPGQTNNAGKVITTDGSSATWENAEDVSSIVSLTSAAGTIAYAARTSNTKLVAGDIRKLIDITSGTFSQTFDPAATLGNGWCAYIRNAGTGDVTLDPDSAETIDGAATLVMYPGEVRLVISDGSNLRSVVLKSFDKVFLASGTFYPPPGYTAFGVEMFGGGGAGGSGARAAATNTRGGGGGAGAPYGCFQFSSESLGSSVVVSVGSGGTGGAAQTSNLTNGNNGVSGGDSVFGDFCRAEGGVGGVGGVISNTTAGGSAQNGHPPECSYSGSGAGAAGQGSAGADAPSLTGKLGGTGGGSGAGNTGGVVLAGGYGGYRGLNEALTGYIGESTKAAGGTALKVAAEDGTYFGFPFGGGGGGGGFSEGNTSAPSGDGGDGGLLGGGGGGGGGGVDTISTSGAGGDGGDGGVHVWGIV